MYVCMYVCVCVYWILSLEGDVHSIGICGQVAFKNARTMFFEVGRTDNSFLSSSTKTHFGGGGLTLALYSPHLISS
jgi:hypothetical protein